ncbi:MAG: riboflavin synthase, partial [bacterium]|nr:riboflavin synthase [bacterium]
FVVEYMPETIKKTTVGNFTEEVPVNLEKSLKLNDMRDGHLVQGHVDTTGKIMEIKKVQESKVIKIKIPAKFMRLVADKGSVTVNGTSLTVVSTGKDWFSVSLVGYTLDNTNLGMLKVGDRTNVETDVLAKYIDKLLRK